MSRSNWSRRRRPNTGAALADLVRHDELRTMAGAAITSLTSLTPGLRNIHLACATSTWLAQMRLSLHRSAS